MIKHIVMFKFKEEEACNRAKGLLETLPEKISEIKLFKVHKNEDNLYGNFHLMLESEFESKEDIVLYVEHPAHVEVASFIHANISDRACVDYSF